MNIQRWRVMVIGPLVALGLAVWSDRSGAQQEQRPREFVSNAVSVMQTNQAVNFGFHARDLLIVNDGANELFVTIASTTATTSSFRVDAGEKLTMHLTGLYGAPGIGIICSFSETTTARIGAWR